jgi:hypothetical protein
LLQRFFKHIRCALTGHPLRITHLEMLNGQLYPTCETCHCGANVTLLTPGHLLKYWIDSYAEYQPEIAQLYGEDRH